MRVEVNAILRHERDPFAAQPLLHDAGRLEVAFARTDFSFDSAPLFAIREDRPSGLHRLSTPRPSQLLTLWPNRKEATDKKCSWKLLQATMSHSYCIPSLSLVLTLGGFLLVSAGCDGSDVGAEQPNRLRPPQSLDATATPGRERVSLSWSLVEVATSYNIYRSTTSSDGISSSPLVEDVQGTSFADTSVVYDSTYYYRVTAIGPGGNESVPSEETSVTVLESPPDD